MIIRLTSVEAFERVLEKLYRLPFQEKEYISTFIKYSSDNIKDGITSGNDEYYLNVEWYPEGIILQYFQRSSIMTDIEYLNEQ